MDYPDHVGHDQMPSGLQLTIQGTFVVLRISPGSGTCWAAPKHVWFLFLCSHSLGKTRSNLTVLCYVIIYSFARFYTVDVSCTWNPVELIKMAGIHDINEFFQRYFFTQFLGRQMVNQCQTWFLQNIGEPTFQQCAWISEFLSPLISHYSHKLHSALVH